MSTPDIKLVREREPYTRDDLLRIFGVTNHENPDAQWAKLERRLEQHKMLRRRSTYTNAEELKSSEFAEHETDSREYSLSFVGVYAWKNRLVYALPKYTRKLCDRGYLKLHDMDEHPEAGQHLATVMQVLRRYNNKRVKESLSTSSDYTKDGYLALLVYIVTDYAHHGLYRDDRQEEQMNGRGRILWNKTIQSTYPFIQDKRPYYMDLVVRHTVDDHDNFFTRLHLSIVNKCYEKLEKLGLIQLLSLPQITEDAAPDDDLGDDHYLKHRIRSEMGCQFDSRRRHILQLMLKYVEKEAERDTDHPDEMVFGSTAFHAVWEEVCREVFGKDERKQHEIAPPQWIFEGKPWKGPEESLEPDIIIKRPNAYWLFDAKYYLPQVNGNTVYGLPGVGDVTKQFLYQQDLQEKKGADIRPIHNAFLMPLPDGELAQSATAPISFYARVSMPLFGQRKYIYTFRIHPQTLYSAYLSAKERTALQSQMEEGIEQATSTTKQSS
ncbi:MAG: LlaJI family restriction endonuclease [Akkermansia sp.]|nr:LlaJI family restriction endonuclease [Akkermansia sp.]